MSRHTIILSAEGEAWPITFDDNPLGWRFWSWTDWDAMRGYRVVPLLFLEDGGAWLCAIEDGEFVVLGPHSMFPILEDAEADAHTFMREWIESRRQEPTLL